MNDLLVNILTAVYGFGLGCIVLFYISFAEKGGLFQKLGELLAIIFWPVIVFVCALVLIYRRLKGVKA